VRRQEVVDISRVRRHDANGQQVVGVVVGEETIDCSRMIALKRDRLGSVFYSVLDLAPAFPNVPYRRHGRERETNRASSFSPFCLFHHLPSGGVTSRRRPAPQLYTRDWVVSAISPEETSTRLPKTKKGTK
jgi:hypothetical protein